VSTSLTVYDNFTLTANFVVRPSGDINGDGQVDQNDLNIINARLNGSTFRRRPMRIAT